jgi:uncharacterized protein with GYD domain
MARYLLLARNSPVGAERMLAGLRAGLQDVPIALERFGGKFIDAYAVTGRYDAVVIADFEDSAAILAYSLLATAQGQYVEALEVFQDAELVRAEGILRHAQETYLSDVRRLEEADQQAKSGGRKTAGRAIKKSR